MQPAERAARLSVDILSRLVFRVGNRRRAAVRKALRAVVADVSLFPFLQVPAAAVDVVPVSWQHSDVLHALEAVEVKRDLYAELAAQGRRGCVSLLRTLLPLLGGIVYNTDQRAFDEELPPSFMDPSKKRSEDRTN